MIWRAIAIAATLIAAGTAQAETIVTRSGEHDGFSRLVMRLPDGVKWTLAQSGRAASLKIDSPSVVFDTSSVFNLIPRARLQGLSQTAPGRPLQLQLGCDCDITSYLQSDGYLVVDILDSRDTQRQATPTQSLAGNFPIGQPVDAPIEKPVQSPGYRFNLSQNAIVDARMALDLQQVLKQEQGSTASSQPRQAAPAQAEVETPSRHQINSSDYVVKEPDPAPSRGAAVLARGLRAELNMDPPAEELLPDVVEDTAKPEMAADSAELPEVNLLLDMEESARAATVNASEQRLLQQIGRAANQGLLDVAVAEMSESGESRPLELLGRTDRPLNPLANISVTSAIDRETGLLASMSSDKSANDHCLPDHKIAIHSWGNDTPFSDQLGPLRGALVREFDDINPASVRSLAKLYLYFGFGAEAKAMMEMLPEGRTDPKQREIYLAMASLLDGETLAINHPFSGQQGCESEASFWSALADGVIKKSADTDAIQQTFARLPAHLRVSLGPKISTLFSEAGNKHIAEAILRSVNRTGMEYVPQLNLAEAAIAELEGDTEVVAEKLTDEVAERTESAPTALIDLIALSYGERKALSPDVPELAASYELENRDTALGARLRNAEVVALALTGQFALAFEELEELTLLDGPAARADVMAPLMTLLTERADDVTFLQHGLVFAHNSTATEANPVAEIMARRLLDLGFAEQAEMTLQKLVLEPENQIRRLMMAEAALAMGKPHNALVELMGLEGTKANRLRADALWRNGEFSRAGEYLLVEEDINAAARGFWHSEDMDAIDTMIPANEAPFGQVATVTSEISKTSEDPEGLSPLAHARALVESSVGTRDNIADLLNRVGTMGEPQDE